MTVVTNKEQERLKKLLEQCKIVIPLSRIYYIFPYKLNNKDEQTLKDYLNYKHYNYEIIYNVNKWLFCKNDASISHDFPY